MKLPPYKRGTEGATTAVVAPSGGCSGGFWRLELTTPRRSAPPPLLRGNIFIESLFE
jgi:hypothetical protein